MGLEELDTLTAELLRLYPEKRVFTLSGPLGAGKTTWIKSFCRHLGVQDGMSSPTFSLINEYEAASGAKVFHFDFYRLKDVYEAMDIGAEEYLFSGAYCFVEWPEKVQRILPDSYLELKLIPEDENHRSIEVKQYG
ncbi:tRNA (adenosine(37)-N6)-threonylcarbamoyltransferase complex ATPase subunit type 1 TsaE [Synechococcus sp. H55.11]|uniref:tRNA (adenosine(37)-N6)-threonylcarbamoyltransferase complex ATPase subunit type 1 TsaE n=1 Tax=Synechococcus sp. H55.11 TaxID=2967121 RepID=UPI0039C287AA